MNADVKVLLQYIRTQPSWVCPHCETENTYNTERCMLCGGVRDTYAVHMQEGVIQNMYSNRAPSYVVQSEREDLSRPEYRYTEPKEKDGSGVVLAIGIAIAVLIFIIIVAAAAAA